MIRDPRTRRFFTKKEPIDLPIPRFRIDSNYVGEPPPLEITITNLNDNINKPFLQDLMNKHGQIEDCFIFYHPKTKKHLGIARVTFLETRSAKSCVDKLDHTSVMGNIIEVFFDSFGKEADRLVDNIVNPPQPTQKLPIVNDALNPPLQSSQPSATHSEFQSFVSNDPKSTPNFILPTPKNQSQQTKMFEQISHLKIDNNSTSNSYSASSYYQPWKQGDLNKSNSNSYNNLQYNQMNNNNSSHRLNQLQQLQQQQSKERESLDSRIEHLFKKQGFASSFLGELSGLSNLSPSFESSSKYKPKENDFTQRSNYKSSKEFNSSFHSEQIMGTPPSPFLSASDFIKWNKVTKAIDEGRNPSFSDDDALNNISDNDDEYSCDDELFNDKMNDKQCTPRQRTYIRNRYNKNSKQISSSKKYDEIDDDRMSLSSLSSGEKLELPDDNEEKASFTQKGFVPFTINSNESVLKRTKSSSINSYWKSNNSIDTIKINNANQSFKFQISTTSSNLNNLSFFDTKHQRSNHLKWNKFNDVFDTYEDHKPILEDKNKLKRSRMQNLKQGVLKIVVAELKGIIQKDINKKMIESTAFQIYENWWDESEKQFKLKKDQKENQENLNSTTTISDKQVSNTTSNTNVTHSKPSAYKEDPTAWPSVLSAVNYNKANNSNPFLSEGYEYGHLRAAIPKMPSFKRKVKQTRNEENEKSDYFNKKSAFSDDEFEKISSDDETFTASNEKKYAKAKNRSAAIIDNDDLESLSSDEDSSSLSISKFRDHKRKQKKTNVKSSLSSGEIDSDRSEESGSESDQSTASKRSNISSEVSSLESYDRKSIKPLTEASSKSSLLSSISQSSISSKSLSSYESSSSAYESEDETKDHESVHKQQQLKEEVAFKSPKEQYQEGESEEIERQSTEEEPLPVPVDKPVKRKVGRPPKANKQPKVTAKKDNKTATKFNEKENVKPLKQQEMLNDERNENEIMTIEEIEAPCLCGTSQCRGFLN